MDSGKLSLSALGETLGGGPDLMRIIDGNAPERERRRRPRIRLSWTVYLTRPGYGGPVEGTTRDVSSDGFYCFVREPFIVGESIRCALMIPAFDEENPEIMISLECHAGVVRVEAVGTGNYGVACHIQSYKIGTIDPRSDSRSHPARYHY